MNNSRGGSITIVAWLNIVIGSMVLLSGLGAIVQAVIFSAPAEVLPDYLAKRMPIYVFVLRHYVAIAIVQGVVACAQIVASIGILRWNPRASVWLEIAGWCYIGVLVVYAVQFVSPEFDYFAFAGISVSGICCIPFVATVYVVRGMRRNTKLL